MRSHGPLGDTERQHVAEVFLQHRGLIEAVARSVVHGDHADTAEVAQEVGLRLCYRLHQLRHPAALRGWLVRLTWRVAHDLQRQRDRRAELLDVARDPDQVPDESARPDRAFERTRTCEHLRRVMQQLPPGHQALVRIRLTREASLRAVAREFGVSPNTVSRSARAALMVLTEALDDAENGQLAEGRRTVAGPDRLVR